MTSRIKSAALGIVCGACVLALFGIVGGMETGLLEIGKAFLYAGLALVILGASVWYANRKELWR